MGFKDEIQSILMKYVIEDIKNIIIEYVGEILIPNVDYDRSIHILENIHNQLRSFESIQTRRTCSYHIRMGEKEEEITYDPSCFRNMINIIKHKLSIVEFSSDSQSLDLTVENLISLDYKHNGHNMYISNYDHYSKKLGVVVVERCYGAVGYGMVVDEYKLSYINNIHAWV